MLKIVSLDIIDIIASRNGVYFVLSEKLQDGKTKVSFYAFDINSKQIDHIGKENYLNAKFGESGEKIADYLDDYVSCDAAPMWNGNIFVIYSSGEFGIFSQDGSLLKTGLLTYRDTPSKDTTADNNYIWSVVPDLNLIVKYSTLQDRVIMRIGGDSSTTFSTPVSVENYDGSLYVCNSDSHIIKKVNLNDYSVTDYREFSEPVYKYLRAGNNEFVVLSSGVYML